MDIVFTAWLRRLPWKNVWIKWHPTWIGGVTRVRGGRIVWRALHGWPRDCSMLPTDVTCEREALKRQIIIVYHSNDTVKYEQWNRGPLFNTFFFPNLYEFRCVSWARIIILELSGTVINDHVQWNHFVFASIYDSFVVYYLGVGMCCCF